MLIVSTFEKPRFQSVFRPHERQAFSNSSGLKSVFENLRFRDGLVRTVDLTGEIKQRFQFSAAHSGRCLYPSRITFSCAIQFYRRYKFHNYY